MHSQNHRYGDSCQDIRNRPPPHDATIHTAGVRCQIGQLRDARRHVALVSFNDELAPRTPESGMGSGVAHGFSKPAPPTAACWPGCSTCRAAAGEDYLGDFDAMPATCLPRAYLGLSAGERFRVTNTRAVDTSITGTSPRGTMMDES